MNIYRVNLLLFLRSVQAKNYFLPRKPDVQSSFLSADEVFVSSGASDELGDILDLFERSGSALVIEPAYPAYVDVNVMAGRKIVHLVSGEENSFLPEWGASLRHISMKTAF